MAEIVLFPTDGVLPAEAHDEASRDTFLLDEGLELLADFRAIDDREIRDSLRHLVKSMAAAARRTKIGG